jgi:hypothetical protein
MSSFLSINMDEMNFQATELFREAHMLNIARRMMVELRFIQFAHIYMKQNLVVSLSIRMS